MPDNPRSNEGVSPRVSTVTTLSARQLPTKLTRQIGARIAGVRKQRGVSQADAAVALGLTSAALSNIECGKSTPSLATLLRMVVVFRLDTVETLLGELPSQELAAHLRSSEE